MTASPQSCWSLAAALAILAMGSIIATAADRPNLQPAIPQAAAPANPAAPAAAPATAPNNGNPIAPGQRVVVNKPVANYTHNTDQEVADWLMIGNNEEVEMAKFARDHAEHKDVRRFAEEMEKDHADMLQKLERFANQSARAAAPAATTTPSGGRQSPDGTILGAAGQPLLNHGPSGLNFLAIERQIAQLCVANATKEMSEKKGPEFDRAYIGMQIAAHYRMIDTQKVLREHATPELRDLIDKGIETAQAHVDQAKKIMHSLADSRH